MPEMKVLDLFSGIPSAASASALNGPECEPSCSARSTPTAEPSSLSTGQMSLFTMTSGRLPIPFKTPRAAKIGGYSSPGFTPTLAQQIASMSSAEASPVSLSVWPGSAEARQMTVISGRRCLGLSRKSGPLGSLARTLLDSSRWASTACYLTWKPAVTPAKRLLFRLVPSMPRTEGIASGLWAIPVAQPANGTPEAFLRRKRESVARGHSMGICITDLAMQVKLWPTPRERDHHPSHSPDYTGNFRTDLGSAVRMMPTPSARDWKSGKASQATMEHNSRPLSEVIGGSLNPNWVEWLMGYPLGWTVLEPSEMPSSRRSSKPSVAPSCNPKT